MVLINKIVGIYQRLVQIQPLYIKYTIVEYKTKHVMSNECIIGTTTCFV